MTLKAVYLPLGVNAAILVIYSYLHYPFISVRTGGSFDIASSIRLSLISLEAPKPQIYQIADPNVGVLKSMTELFILL